MTRGRTGRDEVQSATAVAPARRDEQAARMVSYLWQMGLRLLCFLGAVAAFLVLHWAWLGWVLIVAAAVLPNTAVIIANATARRRIDAVSGVTLPEPPHGRPRSALPR